MNTYALITGCSTGIGLELAKLFAKDGIDCIITASNRSKEKLSNIANELSNQYNVGVIPFTNDLSSGNGARELIDFVEANNYSIEYLVNNAGVGIVGQVLHENDIEQIRKLLQLNIITLTELTHYFSGKMVQNKNGKILNISSIAGYIRPHGLEAVYAASKSYVIYFSESVNFDLKRTGVSCTHLAPGPTKTEFFKRGGLTNDSKLKNMYMSAEATAKIGYKAMKRKKYYAIPGFENKFLTTASVLLPVKPIIGKISGNIVKRRP